MISLLLPTRQRSNQLLRLAISVADTAEHSEQVEIVTFIDADDDTYEGLRLPVAWRKVRGPRVHDDGQVNLSEKWNKCWEAARGDIFMHCGDDIVFRTVGWDTDVRLTLDAYPAKIGFVWCDDGGRLDSDTFGTHGFIHRNWTDAIGRFVPPYFVSDYNDTWLNDVAEMVGVKTYLGDHLTEHMHFCFGKAPRDRNTQERLARHRRTRPDQLYARLAGEREAEAEKLREYIKEHA